MKQIHSVTLTDLTDFDLVVESRMYTELCVKLHQLKERLSNVPGLPNGANWLHTGCSSGTQKTL